jgi:hypothetical protein
VNTSDTGERDKDTLLEIAPPGEVLHAATELAFSSNNPSLDDLNRLHQLCWIVVREPRHASMTFQLAYCVMETICRWPLCNGTYLSALALSQYRIGKYRDALDTLMKAEEFMAGTPMSLAFQAMARFHLGDNEGTPSRRASLALLRRLQQVMRLPPWNQDAEAAGFLREAQSLITAKVRAER